MTNTKKTTAPTLSGLLLVSLSFADTYSLSSAKTNPSQANTNIRATANLSQILYKPHTAPKIGPSAISSSSTSAPTVNSISPPPVITRNYTVPFVASNKSVKVFAFNGLDNQYTPEEK